MGFVRDERSAIVETMQQAGPDAPTLCAGWTVRDLAAHLILREWRMDAAPGIVLPPLSGYTARVQGRLARRNFGELLGQIRQGPPRYSPLRYVDEAVNPAEYFVHHEDVRRAAAGWEPRDLPAGVRRVFWRAASVLGRRAYSAAPAQVVLVPTDCPGLPDGAHARVKRRGGAAVTLRGGAGELLLHAFGRDAVRVEFDGPEDAVRAVSGMRRTLP